MEHNGSKPEVVSRIEQATAALPIGEIAQYLSHQCSLVIYFLYACESGTFIAKLEKGRQAFETRCYRRLLNILYKDHKANEEVCRKIQAATEKYDDELLDGGGGGGRGLRAALSKAEAFVFK